MFQLFTVLGFIGLPRSVSQGSTEDPRSTLPTTAEVGTNSPAAQLMATPGFSKRHFAIEISER